MKPSIVVVSVNPAMDLTAYIDRLCLGHVNRFQNVEIHPAGKGMNVASVFALLGGNVTLLSFLGQDNAESFHQAMKKQGIVDNSIMLSGATRSNMKIIDSDQVITECNFPGAKVSEVDIVRFQSELDLLSQNYKTFVFTGSLPQGLSIHRYCEWMSQLRSQGKTVIFDGADELLVEGVKSKPSWIKPNEHEIMSLSSSDSNLTDISRLIKQQIENGIEHMVVSLGKEGLLYGNEFGLWQSTPPNVAVTNTVGAGDTLVAGLCWGQLMRWDTEKILRFATALSAVSVMSIKVSQIDLAQVDVLLRSVMVRVIQP